MKRILLCQVHRHPLHGGLKHFDACLVVGRGVRRAREVGHTDGVLVKGEHIIRETAINVLDTL